jgi:transposase
LPPFQACVSAAARVRNVFKCHGGLDPLGIVIGSLSISASGHQTDMPIRPIALNRKNALFAGSDGGAEHWAIIASLIETCKLNDVDPLAYLTDVLTRIINGHPNSEIDHLIPWAYRPKDLKAVA